MTHRPLVCITTFFAIGIFTNYFVGIPSFIVLPAIFLTIIICTFLFIFQARWSCLRQSPEDDPVGKLTDPTQSGFGISSVDKLLKLLDSVIN